MCVCARVGYIYMCVETCGLSNSRYTTSKWDICPLGNSWQFGHPNYD